MDQKFGGVIWTNHALQRLKGRAIAQSDAWATFKNPEQSRPASTKGAYIYYKTYGKEKIEVVAAKNEKGEWVILSVWSRPIYESSTWGGHGTSGGLLEKILQFLLGWTRPKK